MSDKENTKTVLGPDVKIKGQISLDNDAVIMGEVSGQIRVGGMLELTETSRVEGLVVAGGLRLGGQAKADIVAEHGMELLASAQLTGQLYTSRLSVVDGAMFEGHVVVGPNAMQAASDVMQGVEDIQVDTHHEQFTPANGSKPDINTVPRSLDEILARRRSKTNGQAVPQHVGAGASEETDE
ncbi:MAG: polymer-forming cytoskeletal protein [Phycisphaeraceae bacterium JB051]